MPDFFDDEYEPRHDDEADDRDDPQERDLDDDDETSTVPCPACGQPIAECADRCPHCGEWVVPGANADRRRHGWFIVAALCALAAIAAYVIFYR